MNGAGDLLARVAGPGADGTAGRGDSSALGRAPASSAGAASERFDRELAVVARREREKRTVAPSGLDLAGSLSSAALIAAHDPARGRSAVGWGNDPDARDAVDRADRAESNRDAREARDDARAERALDAREPGRSEPRDGREAPDAGRRAEAPSSAREPRASDDARQASETDERANAADSAPDASGSPPEASAATDGPETASLTDGAVESPDAESAAIAAAVSSGARAAASSDAATGGHDSGSKGDGSAPATPSTVAGSSATDDQRGGAESGTSSSAPDFLVSAENLGGDASASAASFGQTLRSATAARDGAPAPVVSSSSAARTAEGVRLERGLPGADALLGTLSRGLGDALRAGKRELLVHLTPPNLGQIRIRLDMSNEGRVGAEVAVADPEVHRLLDRNLAELRATLKEHAVDLNDFALLDRREESSGQSEHDANCAAREAIDPARPAAARVAGERIWARARAARAASGVDISI